MRLTAGTAWKVEYEWAIEPVDEHGDIIEVIHAGTYARALIDAALARETDYSWHDGALARVDIALTRCASRDWEAYGLEERQYAYLENGKLPARFASESGADREGATVPARFHKEVKETK